MVPPANSITYVENADPEVPEDAPESAQEEDFLEGEELIQWLLLQLLHKEAPEDTYP